MPLPPVRLARRAALPLLLAACAPGDRTTAPASVPAPALDVGALSPLGPLQPVPSGTPRATYAIALRLPALPDTAFEAPVRRAAARWARTIGAGLTPYRVDLPAGACGAGTPAVHEVVEDLLVLVRVAELDGEGGLVGTAGPCVLRPDGPDGRPGLPIVGVVTLDADDAAVLRDEGRLARLEDVAAHELGHVLGIGTLWGACGEALVPGLGAAGADLLYVGRGAVQASAALGFTAGGAPVPVELDDARARGDHWRESVYGDEVMTPRLGDGANAVSAVSVGALADLGYAVRLAEAEPLARPATGGGATFHDDRAAARGVALVERVTGARFTRPAAAPPRRARE